jgi:hypothetical protein
MSLSSNYKRTPKRHIPLSDTLRVGEYPDMIEIALRINGQHGVLENHAIHVYSMKLFDDPVNSVFYFLCLMILDLVQG